MSFKDPEKERQYNLEYSRRWRANNKHKTKEYAARYKAKRPENFIAKSRRGNWKKSGIDIEAAESALAAHNNGHCQLCGRKTPGGSGGWHVDHNHKTGKVRGILCSPCNLGLGYFKDSIALLEAAVRYLRGTDA